LLNKVNNYFLFAKKITTITPITIQPAIGILLTSPFRSTAEYPPALADELAPLEAEPPEGLATTFAVT
jgi:hypothetical protein